MSMKYFIGMLLLLSCQNVKKADDTKRDESIKIELNTSINEQSLDTLIVYDKPKILTGYVKQLKDSLKQNKVPDFIFDECLDANSMGYCNISSHEKISLRSDIIKQLTKDEVRKVLLLSDTTLIKKICKTDFSDELLNSRKSTYELLNEVVGR